MNTREILKQPIPPKLTDELIGLLTSLCFYDNPIKSADLLFVFGSNVLHAEIGKKINHFLRTYQFDTVLLTGGIANYQDSFYENSAESECLLQHIATAEFPQVAFLVERKSRNTLENVLEANKLLDFTSIKSVAYLSHSYASMRSYLTLKKCCKAACFYNYQIGISSSQVNQSITQTTWFETEKGRAMVWGEYLRFVTYGLRGDFPIYEVEDVLGQIQLNLS